jgi:hypothetical protein
MLDAPLLMMEISVQDRDSCCWMRCCRLYDACSPFALALSPPYDQRNDVSYVLMLPLSFSMLFGLLLAVERKGTVVQVKGCLQDQR